MFLKPPLSHDSPFHFFGRSSSSYRFRPGAVLTGLFAAVFLHNAGSSLFLHLGKLPSPLTDCPQAGRMTVTKGSYGLLRAG